MASWGMDKVCSSQRSKMNCGDTAQIKRVEQTLERLDEIECKLDKIMDHLQIERT